VSAKRDAVLATARRVFTVQGIRAARVEAICAEAGTSKATFYKHFRDKWDLARVVLEQWSEELCARLLDLEASGLPFPDQLRTLREERAGLSEQLSEALVRDLYDAGSELRAFLDARGHANRRAFTAFVERAQDRGDLRADLPPALVLAALDQLNLLARDPALIDACGDFAALTRGVDALVFEGLLPRT
jgi:AcrR family transcriptional regulator